MKIRAIITGVTGMVGEGVLHECLNHPEVEQVLVLGRRPCGIQHPKLKEVVHANLGDLGALEGQVKGYNACFFCAGVTSVGKTEEEYRKLTHDLTLGCATTLAKVNPGMTFCYVSGSGTDSTERGKVMWARVKGKTENDLMKLPFKAAYMFRPGFMKPTPGLKNALKMYAVLGWLYPALRQFFPNHTSTLAEVGQAMIRVALTGDGEKILEVRDIVRIAGRGSEK